MAQKSSQLCEIEDENGLCTKPSQKSLRHKNNTLYTCLEHYNLALKLIEEDDFDISYDDDESDYSSEEEEKPTPAIALISKPKPKSKPLIIEDEEEEPDDTHREIVISLPTPFRIIEPLGLPKEDVHVIKEKAPVKKQPIKKTPKKTISVPSTEVNPVEEKDPPKTSSTKTLSASSQVVQNYVMSNSKTLLSGGLRIFEHFGESICKVAFPNSDISIKGVAQALTSNNDFMDMLSNYSNEKVGEMTSGASDGSPSSTIFITVIAGIITTILSNKIQKELDALEAKEQPIPRRIQQSVPEKELPMIDSEEPKIQNIEPSVQNVETNDEVYFDLDG